MNSFDIRNSFLNFFEGKGHKIIKSSNLITNDKTLLFTNAGMVPLKKYFLNESTPESRTMTSSQKCLRVSGKHNDLDQVGFTKRHHTFFEMLGNFSFGKYFKEEVISYAFEFITKVLEIKKEKLYFTVYSEDEEAYNFWHKLTGFNEDRIIKISTSDNFWSMGDTGPCGPCSEIFYDHGDQYPGEIPGSGNELDRYIEIWNLVFMQKNKTPNGMFDLATKCIDTGMGLERITAVMNGTPDNYATDLFEDLINFTFDTLKGSDKKNPAYKVIADHTRSSAFLLAEGLLPSNEGRGYVLRRIIRRALNYLYKINKDGNLHNITNFFIDNFSKAYEELNENKAFIIEAIKNEENAFRESFFRGSKILESELQNTKQISGEFAFKLYDTYGFPLDVTATIARQNGAEVDINKFDELMEQQRQQSKNGLKMLDSGVDYVKTIETIKKSILISNNENNTPNDLFSADQIKTEFTGYSEKSCNTMKVLAILKDNLPVKTLHAKESGIIIFDKSPFYAESGGQIYDTGFIKSNYASAKVNEVQKSEGIFMHFVTVDDGVIVVGNTLQGIVDLERRHLISCNHTATHLLQAELRKELGDFVKQHGSIVTDEKLRFDFNYNSQITKEVITKIEDSINNLIRLSCEVSTKIMPKDEAISSGAMALFGEKYDDLVRVVEVTSNHFDKNSCHSVISKELCGGIHVNNTSEIGVFKIISESSVGVGIRRIEAITSKAAVKYLQNLDNIVTKISQKLSTTKQDVIEKIDILINENLKLKQELSNQTIMSSISDYTSKKSNGINFILKVVKDFDNNSFRLLADRLKQKIQKESIIILINKCDEKLSIIISKTDDVTKYDAREMIKDITGFFGGKSGGGRENFAQGGVNISTMKEADKSLLLSGENINEEKLLLLISEL